MELTPAETRVLGCMIEKERTTPDSYPLTLNALANACNQTTNREPIMSLGEREIEDALDELRRQKLATVIFGGGSRVQKYRHLLPDIYNLSPQESALLCVLLLRGPQTPGELRTRAERMAPCATLADAESALTSLSEGSEPLARVLPARPGQKERRYVQLLSGEPSAADLEAPAQVRATPSASRAEEAGATAARIDVLEQEVAALRAQLAALEASFTDLRTQLGG